ACCRSSCSAGWGASGGRSWPRSCWESPSRSWRGGSRPRGRRSCSSLWLSGGGFFRPRGWLAAGGGPCVALGGRGPGGGGAGRRGVRGADGVPVRIPAALGAEHGLLHADVRRPRAIVEPARRVLGLRLARARRVFRDRRLCRGDPVPAHRDRVERVSALL